MQKRARGNGVIDQLPLRLNVHVHVLALDGVCVRERADGPLTFHALSTPSAAQVADVAGRTAERLGRAFKAQGRPSPWDEAEPSEPDPESLSLQQPGLFACYEAAARGLSVSGERAGQPALRLVVGPGPAPGTPRARTPSPEPDESVAEALDVNVHAKQLVDSRDRKIESNSNDSPVISPAHLWPKTDSSCAPMAGCS